MKKLLPLLLALCVAAPSLLFAQSVPQKMNYQAVARTADGAVIADQEIGLRIAIVSSDNMERAVYAEEHTVTTNKLGLINLQLGAGEVLEGTMESIDWGAAAHYIKILLDADASGNFVEMGTSQLLTVPYAFYSERSGYAEDGNSRDDPNDWTINGNTGTDANVNYLGTTDAQDLVFKTNGAEVGRFNQNKQLALPANSDITVGGINALNMDGTRNIFIGENAGAINTGNQNAFIGYNAGQVNTTGAKNTIIGPTAGRLNTTGDQNAFIGGRAGFNNTTGSQNSFIGWQAGRDNTTGRENTAIGRYAGLSNTTGSFNTYIGSNADGTAGLTNVTAIGADATVTQDNSVVLGNNANVGIGVSAPVAKLDVLGDGTEASNSSSTAMGYYTDATGSFSTAMGRSTEASGSSSTAMGRSTQATGLSATAMGEETDATGDNSTAMGYNSNATGLVTVAMGLYTNATGDFSTTMGTSTIAKSGYETVLGRFNTDYTPSSTSGWNANDKLFVIGNGTSSGAKSDALVVLKNGNATLSGTLTQSSDERLKTNIIPLTSSLENVLQLGGYSYNWKDTKHRDQMTQIGVIAQEVQALYPELVREDGQGYLSVNYSGLVPVLIEAVKEQQKQIDQLIKLIEQK